MTGGLLIALVVVAMVAGLVVGAYTRRALRPSADAGSDGEDEPRGTKPRKRLSDRIRSGATKLAIGWWRRRRR